MKAVHRSMTMEEEQEFNRVCNETGACNFCSDPVKRKWVYHPKSQKSCEGSRAYFKRLRETDRRVKYRPSEDSSFDYNSGYMCEILGI